MNTVEIMEAIEKGFAADELIRSGIGKLSENNILEAINHFERAIELMPQNKLAKSYEALCRSVLISQSGEIKDTDNLYHIAKISNNLVDVITSITTSRNSKLT